MRGLSIREMNILIYSLFGDWPDGSFSCLSTPKGNHAPGKYASLSVGRSSRYHERKEHRLHDLKNAYIGILAILAKYLESTDRYTKGHSVRVSDLAMEIAIAMELHRGEVENIRAAGLLHDIGKMEISGEILR